MYSKSFLCARYLKKKKILILIIINEKILVYDEFLIKFIFDNQKFQPLSEF